jgi:hypothetical protein
LVSLAFVDSCVTVVPGHPQSPGQQAVSEKFISLPTGAVLAYTDGSANIDSDTSGYIEYPGNPNIYEIWGPCEGLCNNGAEIEAISRALNHKQGALCPTIIIVLTVDASGYRKSEQLAHTDRDIDNDFRRAKPGHISLHEKH